MSTPNLRPLLDGGALSGIAIQLLAARRRLSLRTGGELPTVGQLAVGLRMYISHCDTERAAAAEAGRGAGDTREARLTRERLEEMRYWTRLAEVTYKARSQLLRRAAMAPAFRVLSARHDAERWSPAYFLAMFPESRTLLLAVRGSHETSDLLTNLSVETEPFLDGVGHRGVVESARTLKSQVLPMLCAHLQSAQPAQKATRFILVGHSLGGALAAAITLMLRDARTLDPVLQQATCFAISPPPFLSRRLAARSIDMGVTSVVLGLDAVPRLSAASLDRFLLRVSRFDWGSRFSESAARAASAFVPTDAAESVRRLITDRGASGFAWAVSALNTAAQSALSTRRRQNTAIGVWDGVLTASSAAASLVESQFLANATVQARQPEYAFARHFGMSGDDVERVLGQEGPPDMFLAGEVLYLEIPFQTAEEVARGERMKRGRLLRVGRDEFKEVEGSTWMVAHHKPTVFIEQINLMLEHLAQVND